MMGILKILQPQTSMMDDLGLPGAAHFLQLLPEVSLAHELSSRGFGAHYYSFV